MLERFEKTRVAEQIARQILQSIVERTLRPGDRLPSERSLASRLGVNRASLREALKKLEHMGLVRTRQGDGTRVLDFVSTAGLEILQHLVPLMATENTHLLRDLLEVREVLGREVARLAARRWRTEDLAELKRLNREAQTRSHSHREILDHDMVFFGVLGRATHNLVVQLLVNSIGAAVTQQPRIFESMMSEPADILARHQRLIDLLEARDAEGAAALTEQYLAEMTERFQND